MQAFTPLPPTVFASLSTIACGYPQKIGSYPHPYVDAEAATLEQALLLALFALVVVEIE